MLPRLALAVLCAGIASGCAQQTAVERQTAALTSRQTIAERQLSQRRFDTNDEKVLLQASIGVLQDFGFLIEETASGSGLVQASKQRDAVETGQVATQMLLVMLAAVAGSRVDPVWERDQKIRVSVVTRPTSDRTSTIARVTFQRAVWNTKNQLTRIETIEEPKIYQEFFDKLSQTAFLQAHDI